MTWPGWGDVLPLLTTLVTTLVTVIGAVVTWARISDRTVSKAVEKAGRQSEKAAREAADGVRAEVKALSEKLATNDFPHVEARVNRGLQDMGDRIERAEARQREAAVEMEARIGERFDRIEAHLVAAVQRRPDTDEDESGP